MSARELHTDAQAIDGAGAYLLPGLADMHVHLHDDWPVSQHDLFLANGVTTVRSMNADGPFILSWRGAIDAGTLRGPMIVTASSEQHGVDRAVRDE